MKPETFDECLNLYGADLERWPPPLRAQALMALQDSPPLQQRLEEERGFEDLLSSAQAPPPPGDFARRILAAAEDTTQKGLRSRWAELFSFKPAFALACLLLLGFMLGIWAGTRETRNAASTDLASLYNDGETSWINQLNSSY